MRISKKYDRITAAYQYFAGTLDADYSTRAKEDMYAFETFGTPRINYAVPDDDGNYNGYAVGKHWMDVTLAMWHEDLKTGIITKFEIYSDDDVPDFIKDIIRRMYIPYIRR